MTRTLVGGLILLLAACSPTPTQKAEPRDPWAGVSNILWPHVHKPPPVPQPEPPKPGCIDPPAKLEPIEPTHRSAPKKPEPKVKRGKEPKAKSAPKPQPQQTKRDDGPDLPWPCAVVRMHAAGKSDAQLEAMRKAHGITLTQKQRKQAQACLGR